MAALTNSRNTPEMGDGGRFRVYPVEANTSVFLGGMVALDAAGNAVQASATTTTANALKVIGRAERVYHGIPGENAINNLGAGALSIVVLKQHGSEYCRELRRRARRDARIQDRRRPAIRRALEPQRRVPGRAALARRSGAPVAQFRIHGRHGSERERRDDQHLAQRCGSGW